ncbi:MAG TPA: XRE family transcriptional regulator [Pyrinomonadaceae bacterium]|nr:XRE family transcriptional regulator [Pyrinomonadaceae bacterium]
MEFNQSRLVLARKRRGLSKKDLADSAKIAQRTLAYYETGERVPADDIIQSLANTLKFPLTFFYGSDIEEIDMDAASFRSLKRMTASQRDSAIAAGTLATVLSDWIEGQFELPAPDIPSLRNFADDPDTAAMVLRDEWGIGQRPIKNVVHLLEAHGVRVFSLPVHDEEVDAFSVWHHGRPFVFLNPTKSGERGRTDAAHELGHLTLHEHGIARSRQAESEADAFAASFLMPEADVIAHTPRGLTLKTIHKIKKRWSVSAMAMVHRLKSLNLISEWQYRTFCIKLSQAGYRRSEPDGLPRDTSQVFAKVFDALRAEGRSRNAIARDLSVTSAELDSYLVGLIIAGVAPIEGAGSLQVAQPHPRPARKLRAV